MVKCNDWAQKPPVDFLYWIQCGRWVDRSVGWLLRSVSTLSKPLQRCRRLDTVGDFAETTSINRTNSHSNWQRHMFCWRKNGDERASEQKNVCRQLSFACSDYRNRIDRTHSMVIIHLINRGNCRLALHKKTTELLTQTPSACLPSFVCHAIIESNQLIFLLKPKRKQKPVEKWCTFHVTIL